MACMHPQNPIVARLRARQFYKAFTVTHTAAIGCAVPIPTTPMPLGGLTSAPPFGALVTQPSGEGPVPIALIPAPAGLTDNLNGDP